MEPWSKKLTPALLFYKIKLNKENQNQQTSLIAGKFAFHGLSLVSFQVTLIKITMKKIEKINSKILKHINNKIYSSQEKDKLLISTSIDGPDANLFVLT